MTAKTRYFNLKLGKPDVFGGVLKVNTSQGLEKRVEDFNHAEEWTIRIIRKDKIGAVYDVIIPDAEYPRGKGKDVLGGEIGVPVRVEKGSPDVVRVYVTNQGDMRIIKTPDRKKAYLSEISRKKAGELRAGEKSWNLQRMYIYE